MKHNLFPLFFFIIFPYTSVNPLTCKLFSKIARFHYKRHKRPPHPTRLYYSIQDNFYEVEKNTFFRSKQLYHKRLTYYLKRFKIKTVINLRGTNTHATWWHQEKQAVLTHGAHFYNIDMCSKHIPHKHNLTKLLHLYQHAQRPILLHCNGGADRTGEATAIWLLDQQKKDKKTALKQLTLKYGHIKSLSPSKRFFISLWQGRKWALSTYNPKNHPKYY